MAKDKRAAPPPERLVNTTGLQFASGYLSNSQITKFRTCPKSYQFSYVERIKEIPSPNVIPGLSAHAFVEDAVERGAPELSEEEITDRFNTIFGIEFNQSKIEYDITNDETQEVYDKRDKILPSLIAYYKNVVKKTKILSSEIGVLKEIPVFVQKYNTKLKQHVVDKLGDISVMGYIDIIASKEDDATEKIAALEEITAPEKLMLIDIKTGDTKDERFVLAEHQLPFYSYASGIRSTRIDNIVVSKAKKKANIKPEYGLLTQEVESFHIENMLAEYASAAYSIGKGYTCLEDGYLINENIFYKIPLNHWKCQPKYCGHYYHCRGEKADNYLKKIAIEKYGSFIDKE